MPQMAQITQTVQRLFSRGHAQQFAAVNPPAWPADKPENLLTLYRAQAGIGAALTGDPRWDVASETVLTDVLEDSWTSTVTARLASARQFVVDRSTAATGPSSTPKSGRRLRQLRPPRAPC
jgi:hypothetical protein